MALIPLLAVDDYRDLLMRLSPPGAAFGPGGRYEDLLTALAGGLAELHDRAVAADAESDPRTADETLPDWERMLGILSPMTDQADRQREAHATLIARGGCSVAYFVALAAALGVTITIQEPLSEGWTPCALFCAPFYADVSRFVWIVTGPAATSAELQAVLESMFNRLKPAHTRVRFTWA